MGSCEETNSSICGESQFERPAVLPKDSDLCSPLSDVSGSHSSDRLTRYREFVLGRTPILIEERFKVDSFARLLVLRPK